jgi:hypothetical protein
VCSPDSFLKSISVKRGFISPIRNSETGKVVNCVFRFTNEKGANRVRFLPGASVTRSENGSPNAFGAAHLFKEFPHIVLCEGLTDTLAAEALTEDDEKTIVIGATSAHALPHLGEWLASNSKAKVTIAFHMDKLGEQGVCADAIGQKKAIEAAKYFSSSPNRVGLFSWSTFLENLNSVGVVNAFDDIFDISDACRVSRVGRVPFSELKSVFQSVLRGKR